MVDDYKCIVSDIQKDLIMLWKEVKAGTFRYPRSISKRTWLRYKNDSKPSAMRAFVGFGCSFGGVWFTGYSGDYASRSNRNPIKETIESIKNKEKYIKKIDKILHKSYERWDPKGFLIYCDPPYNNTQHYKESPNFDSEKFWNTVRKWSINNVVIVSEFNAPKDFKCIWEKNRMKTVCPKGHTVKEKLFIIKRVHSST